LVLVVVVTIPTKMEGDQEEVVVAETKIEVAVPVALTKKRSW